MLIRRSLMALLPVIVLAGFVWLAYLITQSSPKIKTVPVTPPQVTVETMVVEPVTYSINVPSFGRVQPRTQSNLLAQVSGQIIEVSEHFRSGGYVTKGERLVRVAPVDYEVQIDIAQGEVVEAELALEEEKARGGQARKDWQKIGGPESASDLALRIPQLRAAKARLKTAQARLKQARVNLSRTQITAPYAGRLLNTYVDLGAVITPQLVLAEVYATDYVEVRLPLKSADLGWVQLPEASARANQLHYPQVTFSNTLTFPAETWSGRIVRTEGAIDAGSQQLYVIAQIDDPFGLQTQGDTGENKRYPLKIGQYLPAKIDGSRVAEAIVIPSSVIYQGSFVYLVKDNVLVRQDIALGYQGANQSLVLEGVKPGDELVLTTLGQVASGTAVTRRRAAAVSSQAQAPIQEQDPTQKQALSQ